MKDIKHKKQNYVAKKILALSNRWQTLSPHTIDRMLKSALAIICLALFIRITFSLTHHGDIQNLDEKILQGVRPLRTPFMNLMMLDITALGGLALTVVLGVLAMVLFLVAKDPAAAIHLFLTSTGGFFISLWSKSLIARPRPSVIPQLIHASGFSYPSGHSITSSAVYVTMAILAARHFKSFHSRTIIMFMALAMISLISFSRIYLGVHYPSDTLSGALIGSAWALIMGAMFSKTHLS